MRVRILSAMLIGAGTVLLASGAGTWFYAIAGQAHLNQIHRKEANQPSSLFMLTHPRLHESLVVVRGATKYNLARGPAIVERTGAPGEGNCVIAGHRDTHFRFLKDVVAGDEILLESGGRTFRYRVSSLSVIEPADASVLAPARTPVLTLVTCYPFFYVGPAPKRFIVRAELVVM